MQLGEQNRASVLVNIYLGDRCVAECSGACTIVVYAIFAARDVGSRNSC
jgi:hypothetical protein